MQCCIDNNIRRINRESSVSVKAFHLMAAGRLYAGEKKKMKTKRIRMFALFMALIMVLPAAHPGLTVLPVHAAVTEAGVKLTERATSYVQYQPGKAHWPGAELLFDAGLEQTE